jgi:phosphoribosylformylglycinamidine (FGAM) synthase-like amidotransferase family enzyme
MHPHFRSFASRDEGAGTVAALEQGPVTIRYVDHRGRAPDNLFPEPPRLAARHHASHQCRDGRILMAHPERSFLRRQYSRLPRDWPHEDGHWFRLFQNVRRWVG